MSLLIQNQFTHRRGKKFAEFAQSKKYIELTLRELRQLRPSEVNEFVLSAR